MTNDVSPSSWAMKLEAISTASVRPNEAFSYLCHLLVESYTDDAAEGAYEALREVVWNFVASREKGVQLDHWSDVILRVRQLLRLKKSPIFERFTVLADLLEQSGRFAELHAPCVVKARKHDAQILQILARSSAPVERSRILRETKLRDANLSRILANLAASGLVNRQTEGREVLVTITDAGRAQVSHLPASAGSISVAPSLTSVFADETSLEVVRRIWLDTNCAIAISDNDRGVLSCDANFASLFGSDADRMKAKPVDFVRKTLADRISGPDEVAADEVDLKNGRTFQIKEYEKDGKSLWLGFEVTVYKKRLEDYMRRERVLLGELNRLKKAHVGSTLPAFPHLASGPVEYGLGILSMLRQDVFTPINSIISLAQNLFPGTARSHGLIAYDKKRPVEEYVAGIVDQAERLRALMRDIVSVPDVLSVAPIPAMDEFVPATIVEDTLTNLAYSNRHSGHQFQMGNLERHLVKTDERAFRAVLIRTVAGVREMTSAGGSVTVDATVEDDALKIMVCTNSADDHFGAYFMEPNGFAMCHHAVEQLGGKFGFTRSGRGVEAEYLWPIERPPTKRPSR
jgi:predicted transcriptional regulator